MDRLGRRHFIPLMTSAATDSTFKKLTAELARAEVSALHALNEADGDAPGSLLVVFKQRYQFKPAVYLLYDPDNIDISVMVDLREGLRVAARKVAKREVATPAYAISMLTMKGDDLSFWLKKGFFPAAEVPASFAEQDLVLFTASNATGQVVRRLSQFVRSPIALSAGSRQLGRSIQVQMDKAASEMDVFWSAYEASKNQLLKYPERRAYL